jgi:hypothetical protein
MNKTHILEDYKKISKNFMTPIVRDFILTDDYRVLELSEGNGIDGRKIYGLTEFEIIDGRLQTTRRGQMHNTIMSARRHYNKLK